MKPGTLKPLTETQKKGIEDADKELKRICRIVEENYRSKPYPKRGKK